MDPNPRKTLRKHINFIQEELGKLKRREHDLLLERDRLLDVEQLDTIEEARTEADAFDKNKWSAFTWAVWMNLV